MTHRIKFRQFEINIFFFQIISGQICWFCVFFTVKNDKFEFSRSFYRQNSKWWKECGSHASMWILWRTRSDEEIAWASGTKNSIETRFPLLLLLCAKSFCFSFEGFSFSHKKRLLPEKYFQTQKRTGGKERVLPFTFSQIRVLSFAIM